jgi:hypothetical protein
MKIRRSLMIAVTLAVASLTAFAARIPQGSQISVRTTNSLDSGTARTGQSWTGSLAQDLVVNGSTVARAGDSVNGIISNAKDSGRLHAPGILSLRVTSVAGSSVSSSTFSVGGKGHMQSNAIKIGGGAAAGALIGGLLGGGKGALIGGGAGAGAGTGVAMLTGKQQAVIPAESVIGFAVSGRGSTTASLNRRSRRSIPQ